MPRPSGLKHEFYFFLKTFGKAVAKVLAKIPEHSFLKNPITIFCKFLAKTVSLQS